MRGPSTTKGIVQEKKAPIKDNCETGEEISGRAIKKLDGDGEELERERRSQSGTIRKTKKEKVSGQFKFVAGQGGKASNPNGGNRSSTEVTESAGYDVDQIFRRTKKRRQTCGGGNEKKGEGRQKTTKRKYRILITTRPREKTGKKRRSGAITKPRGVKGEKMSRRR